MCLRVHQLSGGSLRGGLAACCSRVALQSSEAADKVLIDKRKTINGEDILHSMNILGFDNYEQVCRIYLAKYREVGREHLPSPSVSLIVHPPVHERARRSHLPRRLAATGGRRRC